MIECIFTIDYEIYGDGQGSLRELVYDPAERLVEIFRERRIHFVVFVEVAELEMIESHRTDDAIDLIRQQVRDLYESGDEVGLHLHPQWYNARFESGRWQLDYSEYNLCSLPRERITSIVDRSIEYLCGITVDPDFRPMSFRAGNWLLQPTGAVGKVLADHGIKIDSSVFKGGLQRGHGLDYRPALKNGYYWQFERDVNTHDSLGRLIEVPTYSVMVPSWKMITRKRVGMRQANRSHHRNNGASISRYLDFLRLWYPLKLDFCRMTFNELTQMMDSVIREDQQTPDLFRPIVAIGHTKDLTDIETVEAFLRYLEKRNISVSTFKRIYRTCMENLRPVTAAGTIASGGV